MYSKSIFNNTHQGNQRSIINPVGQMNNIPFSTNETIFTTENLSALNKIHKFYTNPLGNQNYSDIPDNYLDYAELYSTISNLQLQTTNTNIKLLLKITCEGLTGAIHSFGLDKSMIELNIQNILLNNKIQDILTNKNEQFALDNTNKKYSLQKTFTLAPIYSYYITIFGLPEKGDGFDPIKIQSLLAILQKHNINPYF